MKLIKSTNDVRQKVLDGVAKICDPVVQTLSPLGGNVLFEDHEGRVFVTNDGVTIAKNISSDDEIENLIIKTMKHGALKTNQIAGDGTTTTILLASTLVREGLKLIDDGMNVMDLRDSINEFAARAVSNLNPIPAKSDKELRFVAKVSASGDEEIADNVLKTVKVAGDSGLVFIEPAPADETVIEQDEGFVINQGLFSQDLINSNGFKAEYEDVHVLVTDKRMYYEEECKAILTAAIQNGIENLVIVARDFVGKAPHWLLGNHNEGYINLLLVQMPEISDFNSTIADDLAKYLGGPLITEKAGKLTNNVKVEDFVKAKRVYANQNKTVLQSHNPYNPEVSELVKELEEVKKADPDNDENNQRLSRLTNGTVTVKVAASTPIEAQEKIFRYEDAINATRSAMKYGYLVGGGLALLEATRTEYDSIFKKFGTASVRQIAVNCGQDPNHVISQSTGKVGYNAKTKEYQDLTKAGVIDPYKVTEMAIRNAASVANAILTSRFIIVDKLEQNEQRTSTERTN